MVKDNSPEVVVLALERGRLADALCSSPSKRVDAFNAVQHSISFIRKLKRKVLEIC